MNEEDMKFIAEESDDEEEKESKVKESKSARKERKEKRKEEKRLERLERGTKSCNLNRGNRSKTIFIGSNLNRGNRSKTNTAEKDKDDLSEDELDLMYENIGKDSKSRKKLRRADDDADEVAALFDDDEVVEQREYMDDDDELEDFIIRDDSDDNEVDEDARRERIAKRKERHEFAKNLGTELGITDDAWRDIEELFGDGMDYPHALYLRKQEAIVPDRYDDDGVEQVGRNEAGPLTLKDLYEPSEIAEKMLTAYDETIRMTDIPERSQAVDKEVTLAVPSDSEITKEATIITKKILKADGALSEKAVHFSVSAVLRFLRRDYFEVPFIWTHRRDYFDGILKMEDIWLIYDENAKFLLVEQKKKTLLELMVKIAHEDETIAENEEVAIIIDKIINNDDVNDAFGYIHLMHTVAVERLNLSKGVRKGKMAPWKMLYFDACKNGIVEFAKLFNIKYQEFVLSVTGQESLHFPEDIEELPLIAAEKFVCSRFPTAQAVIDAARNMVGHEIAVNPTLRSFLRRIFKADAVISTIPTEKGLKEIQPGHQYYAFKYLLSKPSHKFENGQFLQITQAESDGLLLVNVKVEDEDKLVKDLCKFICNDYANASALKWNEERRSIAEVCARDILFPQTVKWLKENLASEASDFVASKCQRALERKISMAPYRDPEFLKETPKVMAISWGDGARNSPTYCVNLNTNGVIVDFKKLDRMHDRDNLRDDVQIIVDIILRHQPDAIAIGGFKPNTKNNLLKTIYDLVLPELKNHRDWEKSEAPPVYLVDDEMAKIYMSSNSAQREFPSKDYPALIPYCVSIARFVQEPTSMYASLFNTDEDIKHLRLDPLQKHISEELMTKVLERGFINVVNHIGVDINAAAAFPHMSHTLKFVCGLGPRKAQAFISRIVRSGGKLQFRADLISKAICGARVFINCASFLRVRAAGHFRSTFTEDNSMDVLDDTRIHPEDYDLARKMAADALDMDDVAMQDDEAPSIHVRELMDDKRNLERLNLLLLDDFAIELERNRNIPKKVCLTEIKKELMDPFFDYRRPFSGATNEESFFMLTGESRETLYEGIILNTIVSRVKDRFLHVTLPSGVDGTVHINHVDLPQGEQDLTRFFHPNQVLNTCVIHINYEKISVELSTTKEDIEKHKQTVFYDEFFHFALLDDEKSGRGLQKQKSKKQSRTVQHPFWQNLDYKAAEKYLADRPRGDVVVRASTKGNDHISITWKVYDGVYKHIDISELDKPNDWTLGKILMIEKTRYNEIDQILADYIDPMTRRVTKMIDHPKFQRKSLIEMHGFLEEQARVFNRSVYGFILNANQPGSFQLVYKHPSNSTRQETINVTNKYYLFRKQQFPDIDQLLFFFKTSAQKEVDSGRPESRSSRPSQSARPHMPPQHQRAR